MVVFMVYDLVRLALRFLLHYSDSVSYFGLRFIVTHHFPLSANILAIFI